MPAKNLYREDKEGIYSHIYNKGVEKRIVFNDEEDYRVFQGYLKDYLTVPKDPESIKKSFTVHGRIFRGTPHQPKNYFNKVELIAYSLMPSHFHLLLHQKAQGSLESFIRSLCTRYSMYFNKKYQHSGAVFEGPYKSVHVKDELRMLHLTRYFHHAGGHSSYAEYLGARVTSWVKPKVVQSFFDKAKPDLLKEADSYKDFVEKYELGQKEKELLEGITFESETQHLERRDPEKNVENYLRPEISSESSEKIRLGRNLKPLQRIPEIAVITVVFLVLITFGIRNVMVSEVNSSNTSTTSSVLSETEKVEEIKPTETKKIEEIKPEEKKAKTVVVIKTDDASASATVNIREKPTTDSKKISQAKSGDIFELVSLDSEWYEIKLATGSSTGFVSAAYIEVKEEINE